EAPTATPVPEAPPQPTSPLPPPTSAPTATPAYPFVVSGGTSYFNNCASSGIFGWVLQPDGNPAGWATLRIWNDAGEEHKVDSKPEKMTGGDRNWEWVYGQGPLGGTWHVQVVDEDSLIP